MWNENKKRRRNNSLRWSYHANTTDNLFLFADTNRRKKRRQKMYRTIFGHFCQSTRFQSASIRSQNEYLFSKQITSHILCLDIFLRGFRSFCKRDEFSNVARSGKKRGNFLFRHKKSKENVKKKRKRIQERRKQIHFIDEKALFRWLPPHHRWQSHSLW